MKAFQFPLDRVLSWRQAQLSLEETALQRLNAELVVVGRDLAECLGRLAATQTSLVIGNPVPISGMALAELEQVGIWTARRERELSKKAEKLQEAILAQTRALVEARRRVRLLESLKQRRREDWVAEETRELDELAADSAVAAWRRLHSPVRAG